MLEALHIGQDTRPVVKEKKSPVILVAVFGGIRGCWSSFAIARRERESLSEVVFPLSLRNTWRRASQRLAETLEPSQKRSEFWPKANAELRVGV